MHRTYDIISSFDGDLAARGLRFDAVVIGGAALNLLGVVSQLTKDCEILVPGIPEKTAHAAQSFAREVRAKGAALEDEWLNNGPASLRTQILSGWAHRLQTAFSGQAIKLRTLAREDLLCAKLFALCDRGIDFLDCIAPAPTKAELDNVVPWLEQQDGNPQWPAHVRLTIANLAGRLGYVLS
jgi:hypothetical protein